MAKWSDLEKAAPGDVFEFCFLYVDIAGHTPISTETKSRYMQKTKVSFYDYVFQKISKYLGREFSWGGDGGIFYYYEDDDEQRLDKFDAAVFSAMSILSELDVFNASPARLTREGINIKVVVHKGVANWHPEQKHVHGTELNNFCKYLPTAARTGELLITGELHSELDDKIKAEFVPISDYMAYKLYRYIRTKAQQVPSIGTIFEEKEDKVSLEPGVLTESEIAQLIRAARQAVDTGTYALAKDVLEPVRKLVSVAGIVVSEEIKKELYLAYGSALSGLREHSQLVEIMEEALSQVQTPQFHYYRGIGQTFTAKYEDAEKSVKAALNDDPSNSHYLSALALLKWEIGNVKEAIGFVRRALDAKPDALGPQNSLVYYLADDGQIEEAYSKGKEIYQRNANNPQIMDTWAFVLFKKGDVEEAEAISENVCELAPGIGAVYYTLGKILKARGRLVLADLCFGKILETEKYPTRFYREAERERGFRRAK